MASASCLGSKAFVLSESEVTLGLTIAEHYVSQWLNCGACLNPYSMVLSDPKKCQHCETYTTWQIAWLQVRQRGDVF